MGAPHVSPRWNCVPQECVERNCRVLYEECGCLTSTKLAHIMPGTGIVMPGSFLKAGEDGMYAPWIPGADDMSLIKAVADCYLNTDLPDYDPECEPCCVIYRDAKILCECLQFGDLPRADRLAILAHLDENLRISTKAVL